MSRHSPAKRESLLHAALELFAEQGFAGTSTALIAKKAGVASGTLFFHFNSKDELIHALFQDVRARIEAHLRASLAADLPLPERFASAFAGLLHYFLDHPAEFKFVEQYHFSPLCARQDEPYRDHSPLRAILLAAREKGLVKDAPILVLEAVAFGPLVALAKEHANRQTPVDESMVRQTIAACWDGLQSRHCAV
ncbi:MAG: TetR/AcrR family transcriptional regulator [Desulfuromonadales bacterium]|nr:TetR/AcrR family transcriptional regulator [Desulfuromonadales bacterium]